MGKHKGNRVRKLCRVLLWVFVVLSISSGLTVRTYAVDIEEIIVNGITEQSVMEEPDFGEIDKALEQIQMDYDMDFGQVFRDIMSGKEALNVSLIYEKVLKILTSEVVENRFAITSVILLSVLAAVLSNITTAFQNRQIAKIAFYIMALLMAVLLLQSMKTTIEIATKTVENLVMFMEALLPAYFMGVAFVSGSASASTFYGTALLAIFLVEAILATVVLPMIQIYIILIIINHIVGEGILEQLPKLLKSIIQYILKTVIAVVIGINTIQSMFTPVLHSVKTSMLTGAVSMLPGMSGVTEATWNTVVGSAVLIKNAVGAAAVCVMVFIVLVPIVKLTVIMFLYRLAAAFAGGLAANGTSECIGGMGDGAGMLLKTVVTSIVLFMITIAIVTVSTNGGY